MRLLRYSRRHTCTFVAALLLLAPACTHVEPRCADTDPECRPYVGVVLYTLSSAIIEAAGGDTSGDTTLTDYLPDSGQTSCASGPSGDTAYLTCPQTVTGQDGDYADVPNLWSLSVTDGGDTITDNTSGLVWQRCSKGQSGTSCTGVADSTQIQSGAASYCAGLSLAGRTWRLPSRRELLLFGDHERANPAVDDNDVSNYYPNHPGNASPDFFWSSTADGTTPGNYWLLDLRDASTTSLIGTSGRFTRCVSGNVLPAPAYTNRGDGTIYDSRTNLLWTQCSMDNTGTGTLLDYTASCTGATGSRQWVNALSDCEALSLAGRTDWRLPSIRELSSLLSDSTTTSPLIDSSFFPNTSGAEYWSSTSSILSITSARHVSFGNGVLSGSGKANFYRLRCVTTGP